MRINNLPSATPALTDAIPGTDVSDNNKTVKFTVSDLVALVESGTGATSLAELTDDVDIVGANEPSDTQVLAFDAATGKWSPADPGSGGTVIDSIQDIADVDATTPANGEALIWSEPGKKWVPTTIPAFTPVELDDLTDVNLPTTPNNGEFLLFNGATSEFGTRQYRHFVQLSPLDRGELISAAYTGAGDQVLVGDAFLVPTALNGWELETLSGSFNASGAGQGMTIGVAINGIAAAGSAAAGEVNLPSTWNATDGFVGSGGVGVVWYQKNINDGVIPIAAGDVIQLYIDADTDNHDSATKLFVTISIVPNRT